MGVTAARALTAATLLLAGSGFSLGGAEVPVEAFEARTFTDSAGFTLPYRLLHPTGSDPQGSYPLVAFLHGSGNKGTDNRSQLVEGATVWAAPAMQERHPSFVLAPQAPAGDGWGRPAGRPGFDPSSPLQALLELLDALENELPIDPDRLYITGQSGGGWGALRALAKQPRRFAAAILVCPAGVPGRHEGIPDEEWGVGVVAGLERVPLWFFHGSADEVVPVELTRARVEALERAGGSPLLTEYPGVGHDAWHRAYAEAGLADWLFGHRRR